MEEGGKKRLFSHFLFGFFFSALDCQFFTTSEFRFLSLPVLHLPCCSEGRRRRDAIERLIKEEQLGGSVGCQRSRPSARRLQVRKRSLFSCSPSPAEPPSPSSPPPPPESRSPLPFSSARLPRARSSPPPFVFASRKTETPLRSLATGEERPPLALLQIPIVFDNSLQTL